MNFIYIAMRMIGRANDDVGYLRAMFFLVRNYIRSIDTSADLDNQILDIICSKKNKNASLTRIERFTERLSQTDVEIKLLMVEEIIDELKFWDKDRYLPDHDYWQRFDCWTQEEATLLACDICPRRVQLKNIIEFSDYDKTPRKAAYITDLYDRSVKVNNLQSDVTPLRFIEWCKSKNIELPKEFMAFAEAENNRISNVLGKGSLTDNGVAEPSTAPEAKKVENSLSYAEVCKTASIRGDELYKLIFEIVDKQRSGAGMNISGVLKELERPATGVVTSFNGDTLDWVTKKGNPARVQIRHLRKRVTKIINAFNNAG